MDYEQMTTPQLQQECKRRGLPSGRVKAELVARLTEADATGDAGPDVDFDEGGILAPGGVSVNLAEGERVLSREQVVALAADADMVVLGDGAQVPRPDVAVDAQPDLLPPAPEPFSTREPEPAAPTVFRVTYQAGPGGLDDAAHDTFRQQTRDAATAAGHAPRGDAYRVGTTADGEVYEVNIRRRP